MKTWNQALKDGAIIGVMAGVATAVTAAARGRKDSGSAVAPVNATSHVLWGDRAASVEKPTVRNTATGLLINIGAAVFWATMLEKFFGLVMNRRGWRAIAWAAPVTAMVAYVTDYKLVPRRLTPGYEKRVSRKSLYGIYVVLGAAMAAGAVLTRSKKRTVLRAERP